jgi:NADPH:quinone reductase-like Zn-dependent oxidoreductase
MKAIVQKGTGGPEVLGLQTVPVPEPREGQVLIRVYAASVNPIDWKMRRGSMARGTRIPGMDVAGVVEKLGPGVTTLKMG